MNNKLKLVLSKLERQSSLEKSKKARIEHKDKMLAITKETGQFFNILLKMVNFSRVLEIGTSVGYSTLWFSDAILEKNQKNARIITIEENPLKVKKASKNFKNAGVFELIQIKNGTALDIIPKLAKQITNKKLKKFDFVFIDADKENMIKYFDLVLPIVKVNGIIAADNILFPKKFRPSMKKYSRYVQNKKKIQSVTVPIGNGEEISLKISE